MFRPAERVSFRSRTRRGSCDVLLQAVEHAVPVGFVGFAIGALVSGTLAGLFSITAAIAVVSVITAASGVHVIVRMRETLHGPTSVYPP